MGVTPVRACLICDRARGQIALTLDGELSQLERVMLDAHLERCPACRAYETQLTGITRTLRETPFERMERPVVVHRRRRPAIGVRIQIGAAAAIVVAVVAATQFTVGGESFEPSFVPEGRTQVKLPSERQLLREQAMLERARPGQPVQLAGQVL
jgi:predicted anti-sigma-YlaC factor YlaD